MRMDCGTVGVKSSLESSHLLEHEYQKHSASRTIMARARGYSISVHNWYSSSDFVLCGVYTV